MSNEKNAAASASSTLSTSNATTSKDVGEELPLKPPRSKHRLSQPQVASILETTIDNVDDECGSSQVSLFDDQFSFKVLCLN